MAKEIYKCEEEIGMKGVRETIKSCFRKKKGNVIQEKATA